MPDVDGAQREHAAFRTRLTAAAHAEPDFAGHDVVATIAAAVAARRLNGSRPADRSPAVA